MADDAHFLKSMSADMRSRGQDYYAQRCQEIADEIERLRELAYAPDGSEMRSALFKEAEWRGRLYDALRRIDALNDHPGHYNPDIQRVLDAALRGKP